MLTVLGHDAVNKKVIPGVTLKAGQIAQLTTINNEVMFTLSDGTCPYGIVLKFLGGRPPGDKSSVNKEFPYSALVQHNRGRYTTDTFDTTVSYPVNANLYVSATGLLTIVRAQSTYPAIGMVEVPPTTTDATLTFLWF
jgi:hypothetical protein